MRKNSLGSRKLTATLMKILGTGVFICTILLLLILSLPKLFGFDTYNIVSGSMEPEIPVGSMVFVKTVDCHELQEGDIIVFYSNEVPVCHRVTENNTFSNTLITKGDANESEDFRATDYAEVIGIVKYHLPLFGNIGAYISTVSGKLLIVEVIAVCVLLYLFAQRLK